MFLTYKQAAVLIFANNKETAKIIHMIFSYSFDKVKSISGDFRFVYILKKQYSRLIASSVNF